MLRPCAVPHCPALVARGYCPVHQRALRRHQARYSTGPGVNYGRRWVREKNKFLQDHPFCACGCGRAADEVDHIRPHRGDPGTFWDRTNWQALSHRCHAAKTAREVFGPAK